MKRIVAAVGVVLAVGLIGAGVWWFSRRDGATWRLKDPTAVSASTTSLQVPVSPTGCTSGRVDDLQGPEVQVYSYRVVVTFTVAADRSFPGSSQNCQGVIVDRTVPLPEPLGPRRLVDGTCPAYERPGSQSECVRAKAP